MPEQLSKALADKGVAFDKSTASMSRSSERYCYGARCTWHGRISQVGKLEDGLPCCPFCQSVLFEVPTEREWWEGVSKYTEAHSGYRAMLEWQVAQNKCFPTFDVLRLEYATATGIIVKMGAPGTVDAQTDAPLSSREAVLRELQKQLRQVMAEHQTEPPPTNAEDGYWRGIRIGLETAINILKDAEPF